MLFDTHCHIHDREFFDKKARDKVYSAALEASVSKMLLVGTSLSDSKQAVLFAHQYSEHLVASVGIHPHEASKLTNEQIENDLKILEQLCEKPEVKAIGECGFDFYYNERDELYDKQRQLLEGQLKIAANHNLPVSFHVRSAFDDFWPIFDKFPGVKGVLHSFTDTKSNLQKALNGGLFIGVNGIATFAADKQAVYQSIPLDNMVLETDSPFLTPVPYRGTINEPKNVRVVAQFLATLRQTELQSVAKITTKNAQKLFNL